MTVLVFRTIFRKKSGGSGETSLGGLVTIKMGRTRMKSKRILKSQSRKPADLCRNISSNSSASDFWSWELSLTTVPRNVAIIGYPAHGTKKKFLWGSLWIFGFESDVFKLGCLVRKAHLIFLQSNVCLLSFISYSYWGIVPFSPISCSLYYLYIFAKNVILRKCPF